MTSHSNDHGAGARPPAVAPRGPRASVMLFATLDANTGNVATRHRVRDLSPGGLRIDQAAALNPASVVTVSLGALTAVPATIRWVRDGLAGVVFDKPINPDEARKKATLVLPLTVAPPPADSRPTTFTPQAGWLDAMRSPYRR